MAETSNKKNHRIFAKVEDFSTTSKAYGDLTGIFSYTSTKGNQYFLVIYDYDSNAFLVELLTSQSGIDIKNAYLIIYNKLMTSLLD